MKAKKIFGVVIVLSVVAVIASTLALNTSNVEKFEIIQTDNIGVHSSDYGLDISDYIHVFTQDTDGAYRPPEYPVGDEPFSLKTPTNPVPDEPLGVYSRPPVNPVGDEPIAFGLGV